MQVSARIRQETAALKCQEAKPHFAHIDGDTEPDVDSVDEDELLDAVRPQRFTLPIVNTTEQGEVDKVQLDTWSICLFLIFFSLDRASYAQEREAASC
mgnify:CR=1 FL=1